MNEIAESPAGSDSPDVVPLRPVFHFYYVECMGWLGWTQPNITVKTYKEAEKVFNRDIATINDWLPIGAKGVVVRILEWKSDRKPKRTVVKEYAVKSQQGQSDFLQ